MVRSSASMDDEPVKRFPYAPWVGRMMIAMIVTGFVALGAGLVASLEDTHPDLARWAFATLMCSTMVLGLFLAALGCAIPGPSRAHWERTGFYLIPMKHGVIRTRHAFFMWLVAILVSGMGLATVGLMAAVLLTEIG